MQPYQIELAKAIKRHRAQGWGWRYDGLADWSTDRIIAQLREIGIDTDPDRFPEQAAAAGQFKVLNDQWVEQIADEKKGVGFWEDFPLIGIPVLWDRLAPQVICADLIEEKLYRVVSAEEIGDKIPDVNGIPGDLAAGLNLANFLLAAEPSQRSARFDEVNDRRFYDYADWLRTLVETRGAEFPDAVMRLADAMSDCGMRDEFQADLALALARAGRHEEAVSRAMANVERFPDEIWVRILAGDVFEKLGDEARAIEYWRDSLARVDNPSEWDAIIERLEQSLTRQGREAEFAKILLLTTRPYVGVHLFLTERARLRIRVPA